MTQNEYHKDGFIISTDKVKLDIPFIHNYLSQQSYWAVGRSVAVVRESIKNSLCFGVYQGERQIGFARVVTDYATLSWLCDVFILEEFRKKGLGKWLVSIIVEYPGINNIRRFYLATKDAHELYSKYGGFQSVTKPEHLMVKIGK